MDKKQNPIYTTFCFKNDSTTERRAQKDACQVVNVWGWGVSQGANKNVKEGRGDESLIPAWHIVYEILITK